MRPARMRRSSAISRSCSSLSFSALVGRLRIGRFVGRQLDENLLKAQADAAELIGRSTLGATQDFQILQEPLAGQRSYSIAIAAPTAPLDASWVGIVWCAWVSGAAQVTMRLANVTAAPVKPKAQPFIIRTF